MNEPIHQLWIPTASPRGGADAVQESGWDLFHGHNGPGSMAASKSPRHRTASRNVKRNMPHPDGGMSTSTDAAPASAGGNSFRARAGIPTDPDR